MIEVLMSQHMQKVHHCFYMVFTICYFLKLWSLEDLKPTGFVTVLNGMVQIPWR